jgi:type I restriction enzyme, S subunit
MTEKINNFPDIPLNWEWTKLGNVIEPSKEKIEPLNNYEIPYIGLEHIEKDTGKLLEHGNSNEVKSTKAKFSKGDLLYGKLRPYLNKVHVVNFDGICSTDILVFSKKPYISNQFLGLRFLCKDFVEYASQNVNGVQHPRVSFETLSEFPLSLPPLNEQKRIVAKIEALQERSQRVKTELDAIKPLLDQFRQSVLAAAFRGDLTADWREKNEDIDWEKTTLETVIKDKPRNGLSIKPVDYPTDVKSFTLSAITSGKFKAEYFKYIDRKIERDSYLWLQPGDILIQRSNTIDYVGTSAIYTGNFGEFIYPDLVMKIQVVENKNCRKFIYYTLSALQTREYYKKNATGTAGNMPKINQKTVMNTPINLPSLAEQNEIVRRIESLFKLADTIANQKSQIQNRLETLNQSILAKAFRGELVPQDPNDEPASVLLDRIQQEKAKLEKPKKQKSMPSGKTSANATEADNYTSKQLDLGL